jgi:hypothetical protein
MAKQINIVGTIVNSEIPFCKKDVTKHNTYNLKGDGKYLYNKSAEKAGKYYGYIYYIEGDKLLCFDIFNSWRNTINSSDFFIRNEFLEVID